MRTHLTAALARQAVELYRSGLSCADTAAELSAQCSAPVGGHWVRRRVREAGAHRNRSAAAFMRLEVKGSHWSCCPKRFNRQLAVLRMIADGRTYDQVAAAVGCHRDTVKNTIREYGALRRDRRKEAA